MPNLPEPTDSVAVSGDGELILVRVFYATDRARTGSRDPDDFHGGDFAELEYGRVEVGIPPGHEVGELESPSILRCDLENFRQGLIALIEEKIESITIGEIEHGVWVDPEE